MEGTLFSWAGLEDHFCLECMASYIKQHGAMRREVRMRMTARRMLEMGLGLGFRDGVDHDRVHDGNDDSDNEDIPEDCRDVNEDAGEGSK